VYDRAKPNANAFRSKGEGHPLKPGVDGLIHTSVGEPCPDDDYRSGENNIP
jgi:hypothetical protein